MNILLLSSEYAPMRGGIGTYAREIAVAATQLGARVTMVAPNYGKDTSEADRASPFPVHRFNGGLHSARDLPAKVLLTRSHVGAAPFDVVHAADWPFFIPVALARSRTPARLLMTVHGTEINETQTASKRLAIRFSGAFGPRTEIAANSRFTRDLFRTKFDIDERRIHAIRLGVSAFWSGGARNDRAAVRARHEIGPDRIVMVTVARITRRKGHHLTLEALARLPAELRQRITWLIVGPEGEAQYVNELRSLINTSQCDVRLLGAISDEEIRDLYGAADFFCLTGLPESSGRVEGFGLVYLEAGASGLPSIASDIGGVPDAVLAGESGLLAQPQAEMVASLIQQIAENSDLRVRLAAGARAHARDLSWERCAAETYRLPRPQAASPLEALSA
ncbi:glycosyltransferase family 1 protein [Rhodopseudomonas boonkerdii]|uniref:glycosyltransferase family 4 protein n=1 Tax=Rhodopseudomonas boonkerdii TaxID=475937 RepID=UPI001E472181|nr:glycosyltransferase family 4 protein [Rhodopseudomonas boonkerdii]UGV27603.1 glycosyltransferase family 1 protein [Rhodopseudomonas boonkerdii]